MTKIIVILLICAAGAYAHKKGYFSKWVGDAQDSAALQFDKGAPPAPVPQNQGNVWPTQQPALPARAAGPSMADNCARARANVQEMEGWMRSGGTMVETKSRKKLNENDTFTALSQNRQFIADNCR